MPIGHPNRRKLASSFDGDVRPNGFEPPMTRILRSRRSKISAAAASHSDGIVKLASRIGDQGRPPATARR